MEILTYILLLAISFVCIAYTIFLLGVLWGTIFGAPYVPTGHKTVQKMLKMAQLQKKDTIYDLGSGDGRLVFSASKKVKSAIGFEISYPIYLWSKFKQLVSYPKAKIYCRSFFHANLKDADVVFCYLLTRTMKKLKTKFEKELKKGTRIVCHGFEIPGWEPVAHEKRDNECGSVKVYVVGN